MHRLFRLLSLITPLLALTAFAGADAQTLELGITAGVDVSNPTATSDIITASRNDMVLGATASFALASPLRFQLGARYVRRRLSFSVAPVVQGAGAATLADINEMNCLEIPLDLKIGFGGSALQVYLIAGTNVGTVLSATHTRLGETSPQPMQGASSFTASLEAGGGLAYSLSPGVALTADARYSYGLIDQTNGASNPLDRASWTPRDLSIAGGLLFRLP